MEIVVKPTVLYEREMLGFNNNYSI